MKNVLLITADQFRGDCLGVAGHPLVRTPHLDALAKQGVFFSKHYAGAAPCSPARACLYTGLYQMNNRVCTNGSPLDSRHDTLPLAFRRAGYNPTLFGYTDQAVDPRTVGVKDPSLRTYEGILPGFTPRVHVSDNNAPWLSWLAGRGHTGKLAYPEIEYPVGGAIDPPRQIAPGYSQDETQTAFLSGELIRWLGEQPATLVEEDPGWCAHVSFLRPHPPFSVPEPYNSMYNAEDVPAFSGKVDWQAYSREHPFLEIVLTNLRKRGFVPGLEGLVKDWTESEFRTIAAIYYGMISEVDAQIGRIVEALKANGQWENTIIVFTSDHGEMMGDHGMLGKFGFYDASYHLPLIICDPSKAAGHGRVVSQFTEAVDVLPTLLDLIDQPVPTQFDGRSLSGAVKGQELVNWRDCAHWEFDFRDIPGQSFEQALGLSSKQCNMSVVRNEHYKYVHFAGLPPLLFDLQRDPAETTNVADMDSYREARVSLAESLLSWRAEHLDQSLALTSLTSKGPVSLHA